MRIQSTEKRSLCAACPGLRTVAPVIRSRGTLRCTRGCEVHPGDGAARSAGTTEFALHFLPPSVQLLSTRGCDFCKPLLFMWTFCRDPERVRLEEKQDEAKGSG